MQRVCTALQLAYDPSSIHLEFASQPTMPISDPLVLSFILVDLLLKVQIPGFSSSRFLKAKS